MLVLLMLSVEFEGVFGADDHLNSAVVGVVVKKRQRRHVVRGRKLPGDLEALGGLRGERVPFLLVTPSHHHDFLAHGEGQLKAASTFFPRRGVDAAAFRGLDKVVSLDEVLPRSRLPRRHVEDVVVAAASEVILELVEIAESEDEDATIGAENENSVNFDDVELLNNADAPIEKQNLERRKEKKPFVR